MDTAEKTTGASTAQEGEPDLRARIFNLVYPETPLLPETLDALLAESLATGDPDVCADLILTVHGRGALREARRLAQACASRFPDNARIVKIAGWMELPKIVPSPPHERIDRRPDYEWLKQHAREYPGEWLVLCHGKLWGHSRSLPEAEEQAQAAGLANRPLLYQVSGE